MAYKAPEAISLTLTPAAEQLPRQQAKKKGSSPRAEDSDTDPEAPAAHQMLSFIMDDPDFESEASDTPKVTTVQVQHDNRFTQFTAGSGHLTCLHIL